MSKLTTEQALGFIADGLCACEGMLEEHHTNGCPQDKAAEDWLAQVRREAKIEELRSAAEGFGENQMIREGDVKEWLKLRADRLEAEFHRAIAAHDAELRKQIAQEIEEADCHKACGSLYHKGIQRAARIARGKEHA